MSDEKSGEQEKPGAAETAAPVSVRKSTPAVGKTTGVKTAAGKKAAGKKAAGKDSAGKQSVRARRSPLGRSRGQSAKPAGSSSKKTIAWAVYGIVLVAAIAVTTLLGVRYFSDRATEDARDSAIDAARTYASTMFGYTPQNIDDHITKSQSFVTGLASQQYNQWTQKPVYYGDTVRNDNIVSSVTVQDAGAVTNTRDSATVLLFLDQSVSRNKKDVRVDPSRVTFDMVRNGGSWQIKNIDVLTDESLRKVIAKDDGKQPAPTSEQSATPPPTS